jgi:hypothetical protein
MDLEDSMSARLRFAAWREGQRQRSRSSLRDLLERARPRLEAGEQASAEARKRAEQVGDLQRAYVLELLGGWDQTKPIDDDRRWPSVLYWELWELGDRGRFAYRSSRHWRDTSQRQRAQFPKCAKCSVRRELHAHHRHYDSIGEEVVGEDLQTLCWLHHLEADAELRKNGWRPASK